MKATVLNWKAHTKHLVHRTKAFISVVWTGVRWTITTKLHATLLSKYVFMLSGLSCTFLILSSLAFIWVPADKNKMTPPTTTIISSSSLRCSLSHSSSLALLELFFITVSRCSKYGAPQTADLGWTADPCISNSTPKVPRLQGLPPCGCGRSAASVIHPLARSPASEYWFLFPQSPGERGRKD